MKLRNILIATLILCTVGLCAYSLGYRYAILCAELVSVSEGGYELAFNGQIHSYLGWTEVH